MQAYHIKYHIRGKEDKTNSISVDARDAKSAKKKIGKKHGYADGRMIVLDECRVIGYF